MLRSVAFRKCNKNGIKILFWSGPFLTKKFKHTNTDLGTEEDEPSFGAAEDANGTSFPGRYELFFFSFSLSISLS